MNNENKIVVTSWTGKSWEMTPEQIEAAYRYKERQYRIEDAKTSLNLMRTGLKKNTAIPTMRLLSTQRIWPNVFRIILIVICRKTACGLALSQKCLTPLERRVQYDYKRYD